MGDIGRTAAMSVTGDENLTHMATRPDACNGASPGPPPQPRLFGRGVGTGIPFTDGLEAFGLAGASFFGLRISRLLLRCPLAIGSLLRRVRAWWPTP